MYCDWPTTCLVWKKDNGRADTDIRKASVKMKLFCLFTHTILIKRHNLYWGEWNWILMKINMTCMIHTTSVLWFSHGSGGGFSHHNFSHQVLQDLRILQDHLDRQGHQVLQDLHSHQDHQDHLDHQDHQGLLIQENICKKALSICAFLWFLLFFKFDVFNTSDTNSPS